MQRINREKFAELAISSSVGAEGVSDRFRTCAKDFVKTAIGFDGTWELEETMDPAAADAKISIGATLCAIVLEAANGKAWV